MNQYTTYKVPKSQCPKNASQIFIVDLTQGGQVTYLPRLTALDYDRIYDNLSNVCNIVAADHVTVLASSEQQARTVVINLLREFCGELTTELLRVMEIDSHNVDRDQLDKLHVKFSRTSRELDATNDRVDNLLLANKTLKNQLEEERNENEGYKAQVEYLKRQMFMLNEQNIRAQFELQYNQAVARQTARNYQMEIEALTESLKDAAVHSDLGECDAASVKRLREVIDRVESLSNRYEFVFKSTHRRQS